MVLKTACEAAGSLPHTLQLPDSCQGTQKLFFPEASNPYFCKPFPLLDASELLPCQWGRTTRAFPDDGERERMWMGPEQEKNLASCCSWCYQVKQFLSKWHVVLYTLKNQRPLWIVQF